MSIIKKGTYKFVDQPSLSPVSSGTREYPISFISNNQNFSYIKFWNGQSLLFIKSNGSEVSACEYNGSEYVWDEKYKNIKILNNVTVTNTGALENMSLFTWFQNNAVKIEDTKKTLKVNGKVLLKVNDKYLKNLNDSPIFAAKKAEVVSAGETWLINENPDITVETFMKTDVTGKLNPLTGNNTYGDPVKMYMIGVQQGNAFAAGINPEGYGGVFYGNMSGGSEKSWQYLTVNSESYTVTDTTKLRTITFDSAPTGDLLTWLQANAVKQ